MAKHYQPRRGKVSAVQEQCLQINAEFLIEELDSPEIVPKLRSKFVLDGHDEENILGAGNARYPRKEQNKRLIDTIVRRRSQGFEAFMAALEDTGHDKAATQLRDTLARLETNNIHGASQTKTSTSVVEDKKQLTLRIPQAPAGQGLQAPLGLEALSGAEAAWSNTVSDGLAEKQKQEGDLPGDQENAVGHLTQRVDNIDNRLCVVESREHTMDLIRGLEQELEDMRAERENLLKERSDLTLQIQKLQGQTAEQKEKIAELTSLLNTKSEQLEQANQKIGSLEKRISDQENENKSNKNKISKLQLREKEFDSTITALKQNLATQRDQYEKDKTRLRSENLRERRAQEERMKGVESRLQAMEAMMKTGVPPKPAPQSNRLNLNFPTLQHKDNRLKKKH